MISTFFQPFEAAVVDGGARGIMAAYQYVLSLYHCIREVLVQEVVYFIIKITRVDNNAVLG